MKWTYQGQEISYPEARALEATGQAHVDTASPNVGHMRPGASQSWLEAQRPILTEFIQYVYDQVDKTTLKLNPDATYIDGFLAQKRGPGDD